MLEQPPHIPNAPGAYIFRKGKIPIYIGKATDLKKRLISYWRKNAGQKVARLLNEATGIEWIEAASEADALLKEASLIKQHIPKYNIVMRDDKNYFYAGITKEQFPRIFLTHQPQSYEIRSHKVGATQYIGLFTSGSALKSTLRLLRRIFPYCTCKRPHKRPCLNAQIGRCPGYCCIKDGLGNVPTTQRPLASWNIQYRENIRHIIVVLSGKRKKLLSQLRRQMQMSAKQQDFERAARIRDQISGLENIFSHERFLEVRPPTGRGRTSPRGQWTKIERNIKSLFNTAKNISRVEGYDISNISGTEATGSMVVFIDGLPTKSEYRKFRIKTVHQPSDVDMLKEVIRRRILHKEWRMPDLMLIDGGRPQLNAAASALKEVPRLRSGTKILMPELIEGIPNVRHRILLAGLAKKEEELYLTGRAKPILLDTLPSDTAFFFQRVRDESHRFAKKYHHKLREISLRNA